MSGKLSCFIAAVALIVMLAAVITNAIYVKNTADYVLMLIDDQDSSISDISQYWDERIPKLRLTLSQKELEEISLNINEAMICAEKQDDEEYKKSMARLRRAIEGIRKREEFSLENIL